jgi:CHAD domain-containing protein
MAKALPVFAVQPQGLLIDNAPLILHTRLEEMVRWSAMIGDPARVEELHNMRIAAKRLRYTLEIFAPCYPGREYKWLYDQVKSVQEQIGEIHDADVRGPLFENFNAVHANKRPEIRVGLDRLARDEAQTRARLYRKFLTFWTKIQRQNFRQRFLQCLAVSQPLSPDEETPNEQTP